jgi:hypothetical protein
MVNCADVIEKVSFIQCFAVRNLLAVHTGPTESGRTNQIVTKHFTTRWFMILRSPHSE